MSAMITIAIANEKGGVGKTTTAVTIATGLAGLGYKVVLVDTDAQGHCALYLGLDKANALFDLLITEKSVTHCITYANHARHLAVLRSGSKTTIAKTVLSAQRAPVDILARALEPLQNVADYCVIDTAPSKDSLNLATLYAANLVLIPTLCETLALNGVKAIIETIADLRNTYDATTALLGIIPIKYRKTTKEHHTNLIALAQAYGHLVYPVIPNAIIVAASTAYQTPLWDYAPRSPATLAYQRVVKRILADVT